jgi:hypothetical protein
MAAAAWLSDELRQIGLPAETYLFPVELSPRCDPPLPTTPALLTYVPEGREDFYGMPHIVAIANHFPELNIDIMGSAGGRNQLAEPNVTFHGFVEDPRFLYERAIFVLRAVAHDAFGATVREGLVYGREVLYSYRTPHTVKIEFDDPATSVRAIGNLLDRYWAGRLQPNTAGTRWVRSELDPSVLSRQIADRLCKFLA